MYATSGQTFHEGGDDDLGSRFAIQVNTTLDSVPRGDELSSVHQTRDYENHPWETTILTLAVEDYSKTSSGVYVPLCLNIETSVENNHISMTNPLRSHSPDPPSAGGGCILEFERLHSITRNLYRTTDDILELLQEDF